MTARDFKAGLSRKNLNILTARCVLFFLVGILVSAGILFPVFFQSHASSYAESFRLISRMKHELLFHSFIIYLVAALLVILAVGVASLLYSHRIAGPLYRLTLFARSVADGYLREQVRLRQKDEVRHLADELNRMARFYQETIREASDVLAEIHAMVEKGAAEPQEGMPEKTFARVARRWREFEKIIGRVRIGGLPGAFERRGVQWLRPGITGEENFSFIREIRHALFSCSLVSP